MPKAALMANDTDARTLDSAALLKDIAASTGIAPEALESLLLTDDDLDNLCDAVLAQFAVPAKKPIDAKG